MRNNKSKIIELCKEYEVQITLASEGCIVFYKNTHETDLIHFDEEITLDYFLDNFEMVADFSKLQINVHQVEQ